ncbi:MAG: asparagine synthase (glutamine-hydrolyzing) [Candidatus Omnitrophota bacterium]|nr:asparagine synthase (glutamine-hydrolyzing) [Candidatus Omnitrophota bacterium]
MCGIAGIIKLNSDNKLCENLIRQSLEETKHRGPDHRGIFSETVKSWSICFGMNRLAIIDLTSLGNQPMYLDDRVIVYNGEIYNYLELKEELIKKGHWFLGNSDTEVILHAFKEWGITKSISRFVGMFAMAIFDRAASKLYLIRDRVGEKPLYYYYDRQLFVFASELKGILIHEFVKKDFDENSIFNYFIFNSVAVPQSLFKGIKQVCPGEILTVDLKLDKVEVETLTYWQLPELVPDNFLTEKRVLSDLTSLIYEAVKIRLRSDAAVGIFLSGGIDSSLIAAMASEISPYIKTFTIGYQDKKHDETRYAEYVAKHLRVNHTTIHLDEQSADVNFENLARISDDCTANLSLIPYNSLARKTREHVKVALSGDGGDEFFCGYTNYSLLVKLFKYKYAIKVLSSVFCFNRKANIINDIVSRADNISTIMAHFRVKGGLMKVENIFRRSLVKKEIHQRIDIKRKLLERRMNSSFWNLNYYDGAGNYLTDTVLKTTDRTSMAHSLEVRPVLTDHRIIEYMARVPENIILKGNKDKFLLRAILSRYLPKKFVFSRVKKGFSVPLISDYNTKWQKAITGALDIFRGIKFDFFNQPQVERILTENKNRRNMELQSRLVFLAHFMKIWGVD